MARGVATPHRPPTTAEALAAISATHEARRREKAERHKMADWLVDTLLENAALRADIRAIVAAASDGGYGRITGAIRFGNPHLAAILDRVARV